MRPRGGLPKGARRLAAQGCVRAGPPLSPLPTAGCSRARRPTCRRHLSPPGRAAVDVPTPPPRPRHPPGCLPTRCRGAVLWFLGEGFCPPPRTGLRLRGRADALHLSLPLPAGASNPRHRRLGCRCCTLNHRKCRVALPPPPLPPTIPPSLLDFLVSAGPARYVTRRPLRRRPLRRRPLPAGRPRLRSAMRPDRRVLRRRPTGVVRQWRARAHWMR